MDCIETSYYKKFRCTADKCPFTCCQQWRISVDDETYKKWKDIPGTASGQESVLSANVGTDCDGRYLVFDENQKCRCLTENGLCSVERRYGQGTTPETCHIFPRIDKKFERRTEHTVTAGCPVVADMMFNEEFRLETAEGKKAETFPGGQMELIRDTIIRLILDRDHSPEEAMMMGYYILLDQREKSGMGQCNTALYTDAGFKRKLTDAVRGAETDAFECMEERNEIFRDLIYDYLKQGLYMQYLEKMEITAEEISGCVDTERMTRDIEAFESWFGKCENFMRNWLANEVFVDLLRCNAGPVDMLKGMQWTALSYAGIKQALFINWINSRRDMTYDNIRDMIVAMVRITGYDEAGIEDYLRRRFKSPVWDWGYFALLSGK